MMIYTVTDNIYSIFVV